MGGQTGPAAVALRCKNLRHVAEDPARLTPVAIHPASPLLPAKGLES